MICVLRLFDVGPFVLLAVILATRISGAIIIATGAIAIINRRVLIVVGIVPRVCRRRHGKKRVLVAKISKILRSLDGTEVDVVDTGLSA